MRDIKLRSQTSGVNRCGIALHVALKARSLDTFSVDVGDGGVLERVAVAVVEIGLLENGKVGETFQKELIWKSEY